MDEAANNKIHLVEINRQLTELANLAEEWVNLLNILSEADQVAVKFGQWSIRDILAHFSGWNILTIDTITKTLSGSNDITWVKDFDKFNARNVKARRNLSWEDLYLEFIDTLLSLIYLYGTLTADQWQLAIGGQSDFTVADSLAADLKQYRDDHLPEVLKVFPR